MFLLCNRSVSFWHVTDRCQTVVAERRSATDSVTTKNVTDRALAPQLRRYNRRPGKNGFRRQFGV